MKTIVLISAIVVAILAYFEPLWLMIAWYVPLMWFGCPQYNALSSSCSEFTADFVMSRMIVLFVIIIVSWAVLNLYHDRK